MSLHPKKFILALSAPKEPAARVMLKAFGFTVSAAHTRRPRVHRLEASKPRGSSVGDK